MCVVIFLSLIWYSWKNWVKWLGNVLVKIGGFESMLLGVIL